DRRRRLSRALARRVAIVASLHPDAARRTTRRVDLSQLREAGRGTLYPPLARREAIIVCVDNPPQAMVHDPTSPWMRAWANGGTSVRAALSTRAATPHGIFGGTFEAGGAGRASVGVHAKGSNLVPPNPPCSSSSRTARPYSAGRHSTRRRRSR